MNENIDFNSPEWKKHLEGKSPEAIAELVEQVYRQREKAEDTSRGCGVFIVVAILLVLLAAVLAYLVKITVPASTPPESQTTARSLGCRCYASSVSSRDTVRRAMP